jgi:hypothetical protein
MSRPTEIAENAFQFAMHELQEVKTTTNDQVDLHLRSALSNMAYGLKNLSIGVRATYILHASGGSAEGSASPTLRGEP